MAVPLGRILACLLPLLLGAAPVRAEPPRKDMLLYCGITMIRPMTEIARAFEAQAPVRITLSQGGSEDLYQSLKGSRQGDLYLPGEPTFRTKYLPEGLLGDVALVGHNQLAMVVRKGNPKGLKGDLKELLRKDLLVIVGDARSGSVGKETKDVLDMAGIYSKVVQNAVLLAPDSRVLSNAMRKGEADVILNWRATAFFPENAPLMEVIDLDTRKARPQELLLSLLTFSPNPELAKRFMAFTAGPEGQAIFRRWGFLDNSKPRP